MPRYRFAGRDPQGETRVGSIEAKTREAALRLLGGTNLTITNIAPAEGEKKNIFSNLFRNIPVDELIMFTRELGTLLKAGIPIRRCMEILNGGVSAPYLRQITTSFIEGLSAGKSLSELFKDYPHVFSKLHVSMVSVGETSGNLPRALSRVSVQIEEEEKIRQLLLTALIYPAITLGFAFLMVAFIVFVCIPWMESLYGDLGFGLPLPTRIVVGGARFFAGNWLLIIGTVIFLGIILWRFSFTQNGIKQRDKILLILPWIAPFIKQIAIGRFSRTMANLYGGGIPVISSMTLAAEVTGNSIFQDAVLEAKERLKEGGSISSRLAATKIFTPVALGMIGAGEESGELEEMLKELADFSDRQIERSVKKITKVIEPLLLSITGLFIGAIIVTLSLPFLDISALVQHGG